MAISASAAALDPKNRGKREAAYQQGDTADRKSEKQVLHMSAQFATRVTRI
jgi:hypothetical protein